MKALLLFTFSLSIISCNKHTCALQVETNKQKFKTHLHIIYSYERDAKKVLINDYRDAINFLSIVTGVDSRADYSSTFGYRNRSNYKEDMKRWKRWYKKNNCWLTDRYIDSAFKSVKP
jgi:predicted transposase YbfD/YdcC